MMDPKFFFKDLARRLGNIGREDDDESLKSVGDDGYDSSINSENSSINTEQDDVVSLGSSSSHLDYSFDGSFPSDAEEVTAGERGPRGGKENDEEEKREDNVRIKLPTLSSSQVLAWNQQHNPFFLRSPLSILSEQSNDVLAEMFCSPTCTSTRARGFHQTTSVASPKRSSETVLEPTNEHTLRQRRIFRRGNGTSRSIDDVSSFCQKATHQRNMSMHSSTSTSRGSSMFSFIERSHSNHMYLRNKSNSGMSSLELSRTSSSSDNSDIITPRSSAVILESSGGSSEHTDNQFSFLLRGRSTGSSQLICSTTTRAVHKRTFPINSPSKSRRSNNSARVSFRDNNMDSRRGLDSPAMHVRSSFYEF